MKQTADSNPNSIQPVSHGKWHINYKIESFTDPESGKEMFHFDYVIVRKLDKDTIINAMVRKQYSESNELAILRKHQTGQDVAEFDAYNAYVEECKSITNQILNL